MNPMLPTFTYHQRSGAWRFAPSNWRAAILWYLHYMRTTTVRLPGFTESSIRSRQANYGSFNTLRTILSGYGWLFRSDTMTLEWAVDQRENYQQYPPITGLLVFQQFLTDTDQPYVLECEELHTVLTIQRDMNGEVCDSERELVKQPKTTA